MEDNRTKNKMCIMFENQINLVDKEMKKGFVRKRIGVKCLN